MNIEEQIEHWAKLCENKDSESIESKRAKSRAYYRKHFFIPRETRPGKVSDILDLDGNYPKTPLESEGVLFSALNHPHRIVSMIREKESGVEYVDEGLIATYPLDKLISEYKRFFEENIPEDLKNLTIGQTYKDSSEKDKDLTIRDYFVWDNKNPALIAFAFPFYRDDDVNKRKFEKDLVDKMFVCGYGLSYIAKIEDDSVIQCLKRKINLWLVVLEAKFFEPKPELSETLYHVSPSRYFEKIRKQGLVPRAKSDAFKYPDRIYLFNKASIEDILDYGLKKVEMMNSKEENSFVSDNGFYLFAIKKSKLESYRPYIEKKTVFYIDPCYNGCLGGIDECKAIFTYNNIPRSLIEDECWYYEAKGGLKAKKKITLK